LADRRTPYACYLPDASRQDPVWERSGHRIRGRDGCRVRLPWSARDAAFGFSGNPAIWLPQPSYYDTYAADAQRNRPDSTLSLYRHLRTLRRHHRLGSGKLP
jgi:alpha-glucosidase